MPIALHSDLEAVVQTDGEYRVELDIIIEIVLDGGAYTTLSPVVLSRAVLHAAGPYRCANVRVRGKVVRANVIGVHGIPWSRKLNPQSRWMASGFQST